MSNLTTDENGEKCNQGVQLKLSERAKHNVPEQYLYSVANICTDVEERFSNIKKSLIFKSIESISDTFTWPGNRLQCFWE